MFLSAMCTGYINDSMWDRERVVLVFIQRTKLFQKMKRRGNHRVDTGEYPVFCIAWIYGSGNGSYETWMYPSGSPVCNKTEQPFPISR